MRKALWHWTGFEPEEYERDRFLIEVEGLEFAILVPEATFPAIRFDHRVIEVAGEFRSKAMEFANALHGRTSTYGAHWWLGDTYLWQTEVLWAWTFDEDIFRDHLGCFIAVASDRTPEIRWRFSDGWWL